MWATTQGSSCPGGVELFWWHRGPVRLRPRIPKRGREHWFSVWCNWAVGGATASLPRYLVQSDHLGDLLVVKSHLVLIVAQADLLLLDGAAEISCGRPPALKASRRLWDGSSSPGSTAWYVCEDGFYEAGGQNQSECGKNAQWTQPSLACRGNEAYPTKNCWKPKQI